MITYSARAKLVANPTAINLLNLMDSKKTNLCVAADLTTKSELLKLVDLVGPEVCLIKTHIDIVEDFDDDLIVQLGRLAEKHNFLIFEDRKFADIGNTVKHQYQGGIYHIADWAHIVNAHALPGPGIVEGLERIGLPKNRGLLLVAEMSSEGNLAQGGYTAASVHMAEEHRNFVIGFIAQRRLSEDPAFITIAPGIQFTGGGDHLKQQYTTPEVAIGERGVDTIIVGRGIYEAADPLVEARKYREAGWEAYRKRLN